MNINLKEKTIAIVGLGYVGLPLAVEFGKARRVIGYDIDSQRIDELVNFQDRTLEVSSEEIRESRFLTFSSSPEDLKEAQIYIITVPTPVDKANRPDMSSLVSASQTVGRVLKNGDIVIYESTVYPGATEEVCVPILESISGLEYIFDKFNLAASVESGFFCGYSPERVNPGDKKHRLADIKKITSGSTVEIAEVIDRLYQEIIKAGTHKASSIKVAEAAKVIENSQRDLNIAFINELSIIFNYMGIDTAEVLAAAGTKWNFLPFKPGLVGGHCIGVDPYYLTHKAEQLGYHPQVILAGRKINDEIPRYVARNIIKRMLNNGIDASKSKVGVLGVTFKENCPDIRNSKVFDMVDEMKSWGINVVVCDPWADEEDVYRNYGIKMTSMINFSELDSLVIAVAHSCYSDFSAISLRKLCGEKIRPVFADLKSIFDKSAIQSVGFDIFRL
jgi:UDP-N-acetyl-D-galactosamine dehydrogenase